MGISRSADLALNLLEGTDTSKQQEVAAKLNSLLRTDHLADIAVKISSDPDQVIYSKLLTDATAIFLSDNPNEYVAAMLGIAQENVVNDIEVIVKEIEKVLRVMTAFIGSMKKQIESLEDMEDFPNLLRIMLEVQTEIGKVIEETASLQSRISRERSFSDTRVESITSHICSILENNSTVKDALGIHDPDAERRADFRALVDYVEYLIDKLKEKVENMRDFDEKFAQNIDPMDIFYKNFSLLYEYLCDASDRATFNATKWKTSNMTSMGENCNIIDEDLLKSLVIFDKIGKYNKTPEISTDSEQGEPGQIEPGQGQQQQSSPTETAAKDLKDRLKNFDFSSITNSVKELKDVVKGITEQSKSLIQIPFEAFKNKLLEKGIPDNILSLLNFDDIKNFNWDITKDVDKYLKTDLKSLAMDKLLKKGDGIRIPTEKLPTSGTLDNLSDKATTSCQNLTGGLNDLKETISPTGQPSISSTVPSDVSDTLKDMTSASPNMDKAIKNADTSKISSSLESPQNATDEGEKAKELKNKLQELESDDNIELMASVKDAINRVIAIYTGDHIQKCTNALLRAEGFGDSMTFGPGIDEYVTETYDNVNGLLDWLSQVLKAMNSFMSSPKGVSSGSGNNSNSFNKKG